MTLLPARLRTVVFFSVIAAGSILAGPPASAGLLDTLKNVRDTVKCSSKAVLNPLRVVDWGMKNFEKLTPKEYERKADQSIKDALAECQAAAENIVARGFGVKMLDKARDTVTNTVARTKRAAEVVSKWYGKGAMKSNDSRMALAVSSRERRFYEKEVGVLGSKPLPKMDKQNRLNDAAASYRSDDNASEDLWNKYQSDGKRDRPDDVVTNHRSDESSDYGYQDRTIGDGNTSENSWNKYRSEGKQDRTDDMVISHRSDESSDYGYQDRTVDDDGISENPWNKYRSRGKWNRQNGEAVSRRNGERPNEADTSVNSENEYETELSDQPTSPSSSGSDRPIDPDLESGSNSLYESRSSATPRSQNCQEDLSPICRQVEHTIKMRIAPIEARINAGGLSISRNAELMAEVSKIFLDHAPSCFVTETRPHCVMANQRHLEEMRKTYESALETARQARGGL